MKMFKTLLTLDMLHRFCAILLNAIKITSYHGSSQLSQNLSRTVECLVLNRRSLITCSIHAKTVDSHLYVDCPNFTYISIIRVFCIYDVTSTLEAARVFCFGKN